MSCKHLGYSKEFILFMAFCESMTTAVSMLVYSLVIYVFLLFKLCHHLFGLLHFSGHSLEMLVDDLGPFEYCNERVFGCIL